jgi:hypothetical protein
MCFHCIKDVATITFYDLETNEIIPDVEIFTKMVEPHEYMPYTSGTLPSWGYFIETRYIRNGEKLNAY